MQRIGIRTSGQRSHWRVRHLVGALDAAEPAPAYLRVVGRDGARLPTNQTITSVGRRNHKSHSVPEVGHVIGRYTVLGKLGEGAMGAVFLAKDPQLDRRVALKVLLGHGSDAHRLLDEARALARLQHPNVVAVHDVGSWMGQVYVAMEHVAGVSLDRWLAVNARERERIDVFVQAAQGLAAAHRAGIVHYDVKPSNIMVGDDGRVRLVDFGIARSITPDLATGVAIGTPRYMSPEQRSGEAVDPRTDQFSLCVALYEAMYGGHPFPTDDAIAPRSPPPSRLPVATRDAIMRGLAFDREDRFPTMDALIDALTPSVRPRRRWVAAIAVLALAGGFITALVMRPTPPTGKYDEILATSDLPPEQLASLPGDPYGVTVHRLSNGLTVHISPNHDTPRIHAVMKFRAGSMDAPGVATLAAQMSRRGTTKLGTIDWAKEQPLLEQIARLYRQRTKTTDVAQLASSDEALATLEGAAARFQLPDEYSEVLTELGAMAGSTVGRNETVFRVDFPSNRFDVWAELEAARWSSSVPRAFRRGVADVLGWQLRIDDERSEIGMRVLAAVLPLMFPGQAYGFPQETARTRIASEPYQDVVEFFRTYYVPNNADLVLVGDLDPVTAIPLLERAFAHWKPRRLANRAATKPRLLVQDETATIPTGSLDLSYHWPLRDHVDDESAFWVLHRLLESKLASTNPMGRAQVGALYSLGVSGSRTHEEATRILDAVIADLRGGLFTEEDLVSAKRSIELGRSFDGRNLSSRAERIAGWRHRMGRQVWRAEVALANGMADVTREDVVRVANTLFSAPRLIVRGEPTPPARSTVTAPPLSNVAYAVGRSAWSRELLARDALEVQPKFLVEGTDFERRETPAGLLVAKQDVKSRSFTLMFRYDTTLEETNLVCDAISARMTGERMRNTSAVQSFFRCTPRVVLVAISGLDEDLVEGVQTLAGWLRDPSAADWSAMIDAKRASLASMPGRIDWIAGALDQLAMFGPSSPLLARNDISELERTKASDALTALGKLRASRRAVAYYGPRSLAEVDALLPTTGSGVPGRSPMKLVAERRKVYIVDTPGTSNTTNISALYGVSDVEESQKFLELMEQYWLTAREPVELADGFGLETVYPTALRDPGYLAVRISTSPGKAADILAVALRDVFDTPLDEERLVRAKTDRQMHMRSDWVPRHEVAARALAFLVAGKREDPRPDLVRAANKVSVAELDGFRATLRKRPQAITIWGNIEGIDRVALARYGELVELSVPRLIASYRPDRQPKRRRQR